VGRATCIKSRVTGLQLLVYGVCVPRPYLSGYGASWTEHIGPSILDRRVIAASLLLVIRPSSPVNIDF
jgi:hypothetical protein